MRLSYLGGARYLFKMRCDVLKFSDCLCVRILGFYSLHREISFIRGLGGLVGMGKVAVVTVELVDESFAFSNGAVAEELLEWFREAFAVPWVKEVKAVVVQKF
jgi:hypothetical protein